MRVVFSIVAVLPLVAGLGTYIEETRENLEENHEKEE